ncbi:MAG: PKD domain-containing protein [Chlorobi bacterium]|nr:PKD domain-containing protein [Chlorobiota bacterium]
MSRKKYKFTHVLGSLILLITTSKTFSQPVIDSTTLPLPNLKMTYFVDTVVNDPTILSGTGPNQTWNFSTILHPDLVDTTVYLHPGSTPFATEPFAQSALYALQDLGIYTYIQRISSTTGPEAYDVTTGIAGNNPLIGSFSAPATDGDTLLMAPLTYNTTFFDDGIYEFSTTFSGLPVDVTITVTHYDTANGYGTLILPNNFVLSNILRISRRLKISTEVTSSFGPLLTQEDSLHVIYFIAEISGFRFPILTVSHNLVSDTISARFINFTLTADFIASPTAALVGQTINFTNLSQNADSFIWDLGDGNTSTATNPTHVYTSPGTYTVQLIAINTVFNVRDTAVKTDYITIYDSVKADFSFTVQNMTVTFLNQSTGADSYLWDFGDGNTSVDVDPVHVYAQPGQYIVKLVASNPVDADSVSKEVKVGIVNVEQPADKPAIRFNGSSLTIALNEPALIEVITADGKTLYSAETTLVTIDLSTIETSFLFIKVDGEAFKIPIGTMR